MKTRSFNTAVLLPIFLLIPFMIGLGGCASTPSSGHSDDEKIQQDSNQGMQDLKKEEDRHGGGGY